MKPYQQSKELTTFIIPFGRFFFNRFPMDLKCAQDKFQRAMFKNFGDIKNVLSILDDTIVYGFQEDGSDHDTALNELLKRAREKNCTFNLDKLNIWASEIPSSGT